MISFSVSIRYSECVFGVGRGEAVISVLKKTRPAGHFERKPVSAAKSHDKTDGRDDEKKYQEENDLFGYLSCLLHTASISRGFLQRTGPFRRGHYVGLARKHFLEQHRMHLRVEIGTEVRENGHFVIFVRGFANG